jgi:cytoskeletal protein CcmA (bactofilin family)
MVPDLPVLQDSTQMVHTGRYIYRDENVRIARSARVESGVVLGRGTIVEENAYISRSVIGKDCVIGAGAVITDSHLWEGVAVQSGARISDAILCDKVVVKRGAVVPRGCVLSFGVVVGQGIALPEYTRMSRISKADAVIMRIMCLECMYIRLILLYYDVGFFAQRARGDRHGSEDRTSSSASPMLTSSHLESVASVSGVVAGSSSEPQHVVAGADGFGYVWEFSEGDDYMDGASSEDDDEEPVMGPVNPKTGRPEPISVLKASSMGCTEEEAWKLYVLYMQHGTLDILFHMLNDSRALRDVVPAPVDEQDSDEDEDYDEDDENGGVEEAENFFGGGDDAPGKASAKSPKAEAASSRGAVSENQSKCDSISPGTCM